MAGCTQRRHSEHTCQLPKNFAISLRGAMFVALSAARVRCIAIADGVYPGPRHYTPRVLLKFRDGKRIMYEQADRTFHFTSLMLYAEVRLRHETLRHETQTTTGPCFIFFMCAGVGLEERSLFCTSLRL